MPPRPAVRLIFALVVVGCGEILAQTPTWDLLPGAPSGITPRFDDISFINERTGYVSRATGGIYKTTDAGNTFALVHSSSMSYPGTNLLAHFRSLMFLDESHGFAGNLGPGSYDGSVHDTNILYETFDGGTNWTRIPGFPETAMQGLCAMYSLDSQHLYGAGRVRGPAYFIKSTDGGTNWTITNLTAAGVMGGLMDVYFRDQNNGFVVGMDTNAFNSCVAPYYHGAIARTTNGGASWQVVASDGVNCAYFWKMSWPSANIGYATLQQNGTMVNHIFYKTTDGGATWTSNGVPFSVIGIPSFYSQGIGFVTVNEGWVGGDSGSGTANFMHTVDGGVSWTPVGQDTTTLRVNRIRFLRPDYAVASGARVLAWRVPLDITSPPQSTNVVAGTNVTFSVSAQGSSALTYQWRFNGASLPGANTNSYAIINVQPTNAGNYDVIVGDVSGSITSAPATLSIDAGPVPPSITAAPQSKTVWAGQNASFTVTASGGLPLSYQWRLYGTNLNGATQTSYTRLNAQPGHAGPYSVFVTNSYGSITSAPAILTVNTQVVFFQDNFDSYTQSNGVTTAPVTTNGYKIVFRAASGSTDFKAIFGFDYSSVTYPTNIPPAPHSIGGTTKGLYLTVNKDATAAAAAVNLYPTNRFFSNNFALKFDLWINWRDINTSTEHALFGINHSGNVTNRIGAAPSDGLFFAMEGEDDSLPTSTTIRDYSVFRGSNGIPFLMTTNNTTFGPAPLLSTQFENYDPGFVALFPSLNIPGFGSTPAGTAGLKWLSGEVRQNNGLVTWLLNDTIIAQYTNSFAYTNGNIMIGYDDNFSSTGDSNNFAIFDNIRVESVVPAPVQILSPRIQGNNFGFSFATEPYESYTVEWAASLPAPGWTTYTNLLGNGGTVDVQIPLLPGAKQYYRVRRP